jgi:hypothetical protein
MMLGTDEQPFCEGRKYGFALKDIQGVWCIAARSPILLDIGFIFTYGKSQKLRVLVRYVAG